MIAQTELQFRLSSPSSSSQSMASITIQDTSPLVQYSGNDWTATRYIGKESVHCAIGDGFLNLTAEFNYAGVWAFYYSGDSVRLTCVIDGATSIDANDPPREEDGSPAASWLSWLVCETPTTLAQQNHTLEVRVSSASENTQFCFDQIQLRTSQLAANLGAEGSPTAADTSATTTAANSTSTIAPGGSSSSRRGEVGAIAGWTVGAIVLTLAICGGLFYWYRRRKQRAHRYERTSSEDDVHGACLRLHSSNPALRPPSARSFSIIHIHEHGRRP
ncbi:hypothetical protein C8Q80DRAFT_213568 [Daedaleopsis nitida]|nr:hypothetical protein C8Q80DRAFT_213568 [Daedaleopsis nitida]